MDALNLLQHPPRLAVSDLVEAILVRAVELHALDDLRGMLPYLGVMPRADVSDVTRAVLRRCPSLNVKNATVSGNVALLEVWRDCGLDLSIGCRDVNEAINRGHEGVVAFWRENKSAVTLPRHPPLQVITALDLRATGPSPGVAPGDAAIAALADDIASGRATEFKLTMRRTTLHGIEILNRALASPDQRVDSFSFTSCDLDMTRARALRLPDSITKLNLSFNRIGHFDQLLSLLPSGLTELELSSVKLTCAAFTSMSPLLPATLTKLDLSFNTLDPQSAAALVSYLPATLKHLKLHYCIEGPLATRAIVGHLPIGLVTLHLARSAIIIAALPDSLLDLNLSGNFGIHPAAAVALAARNPPQLSKLRLSVASMKAGHLPQLAAAIPATLTLLDLSSNSGIDAGLPEFMERVSAKAPNFRTLYITHMDMYALDAARFARALPSALQHLVFVCNKFAPGALAELLADLPTAAFASLCLNSVKLGPAEVDALASWLPRATSLTSLNLGCSGVGNESMARLIPVLPETLKILTVSSTPVNDSIIEILEARALPALTEVDTRRTLVSTEGEARIKEMLVPAAVE
ncbi:hypothetical protein H9P43_007540 [Blastocladiella emersonii ATCC 22665]|nr:hypothetical protein H9P43_007540 [Blastocladiella emersonii ATCC 22665]